MEITATFACSLSALIRLTGQMNFFQSKSIKVNHVHHLKAGDVLELKQSKTKKYRAITLNDTVVSSIQSLLSNIKYSGDDYLFKSQRTDVLIVPTVNALVKRWCANVGLHGSYGSHTLRKTWGYHQRVQRGTSIPLLMEAFGHQTQQQTLSYLGIQAEEIQDIYSLEL